MYERQNLGDPTATHYWGLQVVMLGSYYVPTCLVLIGGGPNPMVPPPAHLQHSQSEGPSTEKLRIRDSVSSRSCEEVCDHRALGATGSLFRAHPIWTGRVWNGDSTYVYAPQGNEMLNMKIPRRRL